MAEESVSDFEKLPKIDIADFMSSMTDAFEQLSAAIDGGGTDGMMAVLDDMVQQVSALDVTEPEDFQESMDPDTPDGAQYYAEPDYEPIDKDQIISDVNSIRGQVNEMHQMIEQGRQYLQRLQDIPDTFIPQFENYVDILNDYADTIARTSSGGGGRFNTEDMAHVFLAYEYIMAMKDLLLAILKEIVNHFGELTAYEMICVWLVPIAACATLIANILNMSAKIIGKAFKLTIIGAFINTNLDKTVEKFIKIAASILKIVASIASICGFIIGQIDGEIGEFFSVIDRIFAYVTWALDCITHATGVMAVEKVPKLPKPITGWDIDDPYYWIAGSVDSTIFEEPLIFTPPELNVPTPIIQGVNETPVPVEYIANEEYIPPKIEFIGGGSIF